VTKTKTSLPVVLTMGEPAGIGGELTLKAWRHRDGGVPPFFVIDDAERLERLARDLWLKVPIRPIETPDEALAIFHEALPVLHRPLPAASIPGQLRPDNAPAVIAAIETAVAWTQAGHAAAVVTNPIHKRALYDAGFAFPGHTEFLSALAGGTATPVMMLACSQLRVVPVTIHVSLREAIQTLSSEAIVRSARIAAAALARDFGIPRPRLAVAGLNPHAGEAGTIGGEDISVIAPAVRALAAEGIDAVGPLPADTLFGWRARHGYDVAICMYHDQALIPLKTLDFDGGINITLGLPFVRTSPDHGTALDIAGRGVASETSLVNALILAETMAERRRAAGAK
jgi:4-hydroxythreonine-4-phosphate dehydrogenase